MAVYRTRGRRFAPEEPKKSRSTVGDPVFLRRRSARCFYGFGANLKNCLLVNKNSKMDHLDLQLKKQVFFFANQSNLHDFLEVSF